jgi:hypothetical protein
MKHVDYLYFNIYNYFYRTSQYRQTSNPRTQAMYLFSLGSGGWLLLMESIYLHIKHTRFESPIQSSFFAGSIYLLTALLSNYFFIIKDRDQKIFGKYIELADRNPRQKQHLLISAGVLAMPYIVLACFALFMPRHGQ